MKRLALLAVVVLMMAGCSETKGGKVERTDSETVASQQEVYRKGQALPLFNFSQTRQALIDIYAAKTSGVSTWAVFYSFGKPVFVCPSIGYPIPATAQLTNPMQLTRFRIEGGEIEGVLPQAEPDGTFTGQTAATYVLCVRPDGSVNAVYSEPDVLAFPFPVEIKGGVIVDAGGQSSLTVKPAQ